VSIRLINPAVAVLTLLTLGNAQTRLALLSLTRKVRVQKQESRQPSVLLIHYFVLAHSATDTLGWWHAIFTSQTVPHRWLDSFFLAIAHSSFCLIGDICLSRIRELENLGLRP
jgi:hypothetical protein